MGVNGHQKKSQAVDVQMVADLYHAALSWVIGHAMEVRRGVQEKDLEGFIIYSGYLKALRIPMFDILKEMAREEVETSRRRRDLDYWRTALRRCAYRLENGSLVHAYPRERPAQTAVEVDHVEFLPQPKHLPFADIVAMMRKGFQQIGISLKGMLFRYKGVDIRDASTLSLLIRSRNLDAAPVSHALDQWRDEVHRLAAAARKHDAASGEKSGCHPFLRGRTIARPQLARILQKDTQTLRRWDRQGGAPTGVPWKAGTAISGNVVVYDLEANWDAICSMIPPERNWRADLQTMAELGVATPHVTDWLDNESAA